MVDCHVIQNFALTLKEARNNFFGLGVYLLRSKFRIEDKLGFPWYYTIFSTYDQSLFFRWFPSNSCHYSNGNGQPLILNNVDYLEIESDTLWRDLKYLNYTTCMPNWRKICKTVFKHIMNRFLQAGFGHSCNFLQYFKKKIKLNTFAFQLKDHLW